MLVLLPFVSHRLQKQSSHTYRPVTIKQLHDAFQSHPDAPFKIDDVDLDHVCMSNAVTCYAYWADHVPTLSLRVSVCPCFQVVFVGTIVNIAKSATNVSSTIEDGTGTIDVRQWIDTADDDTGKMAGIE